MTPEEVAYFERLMRLTEATIDFFQELGLEAWPDFGTLLGFVRHRNVIPWDYDSDFAALVPDYERLKASGDAARRRGLRLLPDHYGEPESCLVIVFEHEPEPGDDAFLDVVAYRREGPLLRSLLSPRILAEFPDVYDTRDELIFPLARGLFLGRSLLVPRRPIDRLRETSIGDTWDRFPAARKASALTEPPFFSRRLPTCLTPEVAWLLSPESVALAESRGVSRAQLDAIASFTDLVHVGERCLWGRVELAPLAKGEPAPAPPGGWARRVPAHGRRGC